MRTLLVVSRTGQRPPLPDRMKRLAEDIAGGACLVCGSKNDLRVAHRADQAATKEQIKGWEQPIFDRTYPWMFAEAFNNIGNIALLCKPCEDRVGTDTDYQTQFDQVWCEAMRRAARSGLLLRYFYTGYARTFTSPHAMRLHGPGTKVTGLSQEDYMVCAGFLQEAARAGHIPAQFVLLPIAGSEKERAGRFHYHVDLVNGCAMSACAGDHDECASRLPAWSPAQEIRERALSDRS